MTVLDRKIDEAYRNLRSKHGGNKNDYFGFLFMEKEFGISHDEASNFITFGGHDYGIDGFYWDRSSKNFYLYQFKYTKNGSEFDGSLERLIEAGVKLLFSAPNLDSSKNQIISQARNCLLEYREAVKQVTIKFVFLGDPEQAQNRNYTRNLIEDLENKKHYVSSFFNRDVPLIINFASFSGKTGRMSYGDKTRSFELPIVETLIHKGPDGQEMHFGFVALSDLDEIYRDMKNRFFDRNIRFGFSEDKQTYVHHAIERTLRRIVIDREDDPGIFPFFHNGITLAAEKVEYQNGNCLITEPRILNGAQTVTTVHYFIEKNRENRSFDQNRGILKKILVPCKIIHQADKEFITLVTINNNRQNPVKPSNLRATDTIQCKLKDKFMDDLSIYYQTQDQAFENLSEDEVEELNEQSRAIEMIKLAQTLIACRGTISSMSNIQRVFEDDKTYFSIFHNGLLAVDARKLVLCYKAQFNLNRFVNEIVDRGEKKYWYVNRGRNLLWALLCQGVLNDPDLPELLEKYGENLTMQSDYKEYLARLASSKCRTLFSELVSDKAYADKVAEGNYSFLRNNPAYKTCLEKAYRWKWTQRKI